MPMTSVCQIKQISNLLYSEKSRESGANKHPTPFVCTFIVRRIRTMAKKIMQVVKLQLPAGKATPGPPVGSTLGPYGINIPGFTKEFNDKTKNQIGLIIPVVMTIYADRSFSFILKTPPAAVLIKKACNIEKASDNSKINKVATITKDQVKEIAEMKMPDLNAANLESAMRMVEGTARSMGVKVE